MTRVEADAIEARDRLVIEHVVLVKSLANRLASRIPPHVELKELISVGVIGLMDAARRYRPSLGVPFDAFARRRIQGAMLDALREVDWAPRSLRRMRSPRPSARAPGALAPRDLLDVPLTRALVYGHSQSCRRAARVVRPSPGGAKRTAVWASRHADLGSDGGVALSVCASLGVPARGVVRARGTPPGSAVDAGLDAAARARRAAPAPAGGLLHARH